MSWNDRNELPEEDIRSILYFIREKGDINRWKLWDEKKAEVEEIWPELIAALKAQRVAERTLDAVLEKMENSI